MAMDAGTGAPKGFGFIEFQESMSALNAIKEMNQQEFNGRVLRVNFSQNSHLESLAERLGMDLRAKPRAKPGGGDQPAYNSRPPQVSERLNDKVKLLLSIGCELCGIVRLCEQ